MSGVGARETVLKDQNERMSIATVCSMIAAGQIRVGKQQSKCFHQKMKKLRSEPQFALRQFGDDEEDAFESDASFEGPKLVRVELPKGLKISSDDSSSESYSCENDFQSLSFDSGEEKCEEFSYASSHKSNVEFDYSSEDDDDTEEEDEYTNEEEDGTEEEDEYTNEDEKEVDKEKENLIGLKSEINVIGKIVENQN